MQCCTTCNNYCVTCICNIRNLQLVLKVTAPVPASTLKCIKDISGEYLFKNQKNIMINAVIIDDELKAVENLKWEINNQCNDLHICEVFTNPLDAISAINDIKPDCVFLDIEMPEIDGFELLDRLSFREFDLVVTTAYDNYAVKAFKQHAIDYLLKPIDSDDLKEALDRVRKNHKQNTIGKELGRILNELS